MPKSILDQVNTMGVFCHNYGKQNGCARFFIVCFFLSCFTHIYSQNHVDSLIAKKQYLSAFNYFGNYDTVDVDLALIKVDLAMNYHLNCQYYREFSFVNLRPGENLNELKQNAVYGATPIKFEVDSLLLKLYAQYPHDYRIPKALGDFYNRIYYDFGDSWGEKAEVLLEKSNAYYLEAFEHGVYDYYSLYALGYYQSLFENYFEAQNWFLRSLRENKNVALTNYSLAVTYLFDGLPKKGIQYSERAYELYQDSISKSDAARICGILYLKNQQYNKANRFFKSADQLNPDYRPNQMYLLKASLTLNDDSTCVALGQKILMDAPYSPELAEELNSMFTQEDKTEFLFVIYKNALGNLPQDYEASGNIRFHYSKLLYKSGKKASAKRMLKHARKDFREVFDENHQVFDAIDQTLMHMR